MDPYKVLGVSPSDSDDKIKQAYRDLARKYHPDKYVDNPLADLAQDKMKEINEAYDAITKQRASGGGQRSYQSQSSYSNSNSRSGSYGYNSSDNVYSEIRMLINMGRLDDAFRALQNITNRTAQWYYLIGMIYQRRGMFDMARDNIARACQMEPSNLEYQNALAAMNNAGNPFRTGSQNMQSPCGNIGCCEICAGLACLDCCCDSF